MKQNHHSKIKFIEIEKGIRLTKSIFEKKLSEKLSLIKIIAPKFLKSGDGLQDDLAGTQIPVSFKIKSTGETVEIVHSLAKWKRFILGKFNFKPGEGIYTDMDAIRKDEDLSPIHSIFVDQWDWEKVITKEKRNLKFLKVIVKKIYSAIFETGLEIEKNFPLLKIYLPKEIKFIHSEELELKYPFLSPKDREEKIAKEYGAVFIIGIGYPLKNGIPHDIRAADYDDWITKTEKGRGLNGDLIVWDKIRNKSLELSSMGIRVNEKSLIEQLTYAKLEYKKTLNFHKMVIEKKLPLSIGGGIGQSRLCMFLLQKSHIGEVQCSVWPKEVISQCKKQKVNLL